jgi:hypothetical protein
MLEPSREVVQPEGLWCGEGDTFIWVVKTKGNERLLVGIATRIMNCENHYVSTFWPGMSMYICSRLGCLHDVKT